VSGASYRFRHSNEQQAASLCCACLHLPHTCCRRPAPAAKMLGGVGCPSLPANSAAAQTRLLCRDGDGSDGSEEGEEDEEEADGEDDDE
jgi:hypothetical protein